MVTVAFSVCVVSVLTMTTLSVDRFLALHFHMGYATLVTESRVKYLVVLYGQRVPFFQDSSF